MISASNIRAVRIRCNLSTVFFLAFVIALLNSPLDSYDDCNDIIETSNHRRLRAPLLKIKKTPRKGHVKIEDHHNTQYPITSPDHIKQQQQPTIPHTLIFTHEKNILQLKSPPILYRNILQTIKIYTDAWNEPHPHVIFLDDDACTQLIYEAASPLVSYFREETFGAYKADICRVAALFVHGGYYFDVDLEVVTPLRLDDVVVSSSSSSKKDIVISFCTISQKSRPDLFFQAFVASTKGHPALRRSLKYMLGVYRGYTPEVLLGPSTLRRAYDSLPDVEKDKVLLLEEFNADTPFGLSRYPTFPRHDGKGCCCNFVVHDPKEMVIYFYSRVVGVGHACDLKI